MLLWRRKKHHNLVTILCDFGNKRIGNKTYGLLLFAKFNTKIIIKSSYLLEKVYLCSTFLIIKNEKLRTNNKQKNKRRRIYD